MQSGQGMKRGLPSLIGRASVMGLSVGFVLPLALALLALFAGHLAGACGAGSSGGCEMGAAGLFVYALAPSFLLGFGLSLFRDLR